MSQRSINDEAAGTELPFKKPIPRSRRLRPSDRSNTETPDTVEPKAAPILARQSSDKTKNDEGDDLDIITLGLDNVELGR